MPKFRVGFVLASFFLVSGLLCLEAQSADYFTFTSDRPWQSAYDPYETGEYASSGIAIRWSGWDPSYVETPHPQGWINMSAPRLLIPEWFGIVHPDLNWHSYYNWQYTAYPSAWELAVAQKAAIIGWAVDWDEGTCWYVNVWGYEKVQGTIDAFYVTWPQSSQLEKWPAQRTALDTWLTDNGLEIIAFDKLYGPPLPAPPKLPEPAGAVPEPPLWALLLFGMIGLAVKRAPRRIGALRRGE